MAQHLKELVSIEIMHSRTIQETLNIQNSFVLCNFNSSSYSGTQRNYR